MKGKSCPTLTLVLALAGACKGDSSGPATRLSGEATDPVGDGATADLVRVQIEVANNEIHFVAEFTAATFSAANTTVQFGLDTDELTTTGETNPGYNGVGMDYIVNLGASRNGVRVYAPGEVIVATLPAALVASQNRLEARIPLSTFTGEDGRMNVKVVSSTHLGSGAFTAIQDYVTDRGQPPMQVR